MEIYEVRVRAGFGELHIKAQQFGDTLVIRLNVPLDWWRRFAIHVVSHEINQIYINNINKNIIILEEL